MLQTRLLSLACVLTFLAACSSPPERGAAFDMAVAWKQTAAEYDALYLQGFNIARLRVEQALDVQRRGTSSPLARPLAVIADLDDTLLDTRGFWRSLLAEGLDFFDDQRWDVWVASNGAAASPGAVEFLSFCRDNGVEVFVITSRDQGDRTAAIALANVRAAGLPHIDEAHLTVLVGGSNKEGRQQEILQTHEVIVFLGDNLNDFSRAYYLTNVEDRRRRLTDHRAEFGRRFIVFPNPTDGHWVRAIFGESEPLPTPANRETLRRAAQGAR